MHGDGVLRRHRHRTGHLRARQERVGGCWSGRQSAIALEQPGSVHGFLSHGERLPVHAQTLLSLLVV